MSPRALIAISNGTEELEAIAVIDILRRGRIDVTVASVDETKTIRCAKGSVITADSLIKDLATEVFDAIVLPGGMPGAEHLRDCSTLIAMLKEQKEQNRLYAAICASPAVVLAHHGLIDGAATCYPAFKSQIGHYERKKVVVNGKCVTSQGPGTAIDFALTLVGLLCNEERKQTVAEGLLY